MLNLAVILIVEKMFSSFVPFKGVKLVFLLLFESFGLRVVESTDEV